MLAAVATVATAIGGALVGAWRLWVERTGGRENRYDRLVTQTIADLRADVEALKRQLEERDRRNDELERLVDNLRLELIDMRGDRAQLHDALNREQYEKGQLKEQVTKQSGVIAEQADRIRQLTERVAELERGRT